MIGRIRLFLARAGTGPQDGDILVGRFSYGKNEIPGLPGSVTAIGAGGGTDAGAGHGLGGRGFWQLMTAGLTTIGAFTVSDTGVEAEGIISCYRGQHSTPIGKINGLFAGTDLVRYEDLASPLSSGSWGVFFAERNDAVNMSGNPSGAVNRAHDSFGSMAQTGKDTNGIISSWPDRDVSYPSTSKTYGELSIELKAASSGSLSFIASRQTRAFTLDVPAAVPGTYGLLDARRHRRVAAYA